MDSHQRHQLVWSYKKKRAKDEFAELCFFLHPILCVAPTLNPPSSFN